MTPTEEDARLRASDFAGWAALRDACSLYHRKHSKGPGGAVVCACGAGGGGSAACSMLRTLKEFFARFEEGDGHALDFVRRMRGVVH